MIEDQGRIPGTDLHIGQLNASVRSFLETFQPAFEPRKRLNIDVGWGGVRRVLGKRKLAVLDTILTAGPQ